MTSGLRSGSGCWRCSGTCAFRSTPGVWSPAPQSWRPSTRTCAKSAKRTCPWCAPPPPPPPCYPLDPRPNGRTSIRMGAYYRGGTPPPPAPTHTTKPNTQPNRSDPQRVRMSTGERPLGAAKGEQPNKQTNKQPLCQPPPPPRPK